MKLPGYCACTLPERVLREGMPMCERCGEPIPDPLLLRVAAEVLALRRQVARLERRLGARPAESDWLSAKELAPRIGRSVDFCYRHAESLGARRIGGGPRPRLLFPADTASSDAFRSDSAGEPSGSPQGGEPPLSPGG